MGYPFENDPPFVPKIPAEQTYEAEYRRRQFMQIVHRYLGWGNTEPRRGDPNHFVAGVVFTSESWMRPYQRFECSVTYAECDGDREEAERRVIDKAIAAYDAAVIEIRKQEAEEDAKRDLGIA